MISGPERPTVGAGSRLEVMSALQRLEIGAHVRRQHGSIGRHLEQIDIEIAQRAGDLPSHLNSVLKGRRARGKYTLELAQRRPGASAGDPEIVQELGVDVVDDPRGVDLHGGQEIEENRPQG